MEYGQAVQSEQKEEFQPYFKEFCTDFQNKNNRQVSYLNEIEDKLHLVINKRVPTEAEPVAKISSEMMDASQALNSEMNRLQRQNDRLERICKHLSEII